MRLAAFAVALSLCAAPAGAVEAASSQVQASSGAVAVGPGKDIAAQEADIASRLGDLSSRIAAIGASRWRAKIGADLATVASALLCASTSPGVYDCSKASGSSAFGQAGAKIDGVAAEIQTMQKTQRQYSANLAVLAGRVAAIPADLGASDASARFQALVRYGPCSPSGAGFDCSKADLGSQPSAAAVGELGGLLPAQGTPSSPVVQHFMSVLNMEIAGLKIARQR